MRQELKAVPEHLLFKRPANNVQVADYEVVDMHNVYVAQDTWDEPADLLMAHPKHPLKLRGIVTKGQKSYCIKFEIMTGFSVEDGDKGLDGNCKLFALGNSRWYRLCSAAIGFEQTFTAMHVESRIYWILRDRRGEWMNRVDKDMSEMYPDLDESSDHETYLAKQREVGAKYESIDEQHYDDYFRAVDFHLHSRVHMSQACCDVGLAAVIRYIPYILHHMLVDKDLLWTSSFIFNELGKLNTTQRNIIYMRHGVQIPLARTRAGGRSTHEASASPVKQECDDDATVLARGTTKSDASRKRKREASTDQISLYDSASVHESQDGHPQIPESPRRTKFARTSKLEEVLHVQPTTKYVTKVLKWPWRNIFSTTSYRIHHPQRAPFHVNRRYGQSQVSLLVKILMVMIFDGEPIDLNLHDLFWVLERDWSVKEHTARVLVHSCSKGLLIALSATDRRAMTDRPEVSASEAVNEHNIWRATTLYDQLAKLHRIADQDSDLLKFVDWRNEHIFHQLECSEGRWVLKAPRETLIYQVTPVFGERIQEVEIDDLSDDGSDDTVTSSVADHQSAALKGRSSLRPASKTRTATSSQNGLGSKTSRPMTPIEFAKRLSIAISEASDSTATSSVQPVDWIDAESPPHPVTFTKFIPNHNNTIIRTAPKIQRPSHFKVTRHLETAGNNADIWRCPINRCYHFQEDCRTSASQRAIVEHYDGHADEMLERVEMIDEAAAKQGVSTAALTRKLAKEAENWREIMKRDALLMAS